MAGMTPFTIGADVSCSDGICGKISRLVINPRAGTVTHLVVNDRQFQGRLVPLSLVDADATTAKIRLGCTVAEFGKLDPASRTMPLEGSGAEPDVRDQDQLQLRSMASTYLADPPSIHVRHPSPWGGSCARRRARPCHRRQHRADPGTRHRLRQPPGHPRAPAGGTRVRPQGRGDPVRRRDGSQARRHPAQHHQAASEGPAIRLASITRVSSGFLRPAGLHQHPLLPTSAADSRSDSNDTT